MSSLKVTLIYLHHLHGGNVVWFLTAHNQDLFKFCSLDATNKNCVKTKYISSCMHGLNI